jgi:hypothetical protein
MTAIPVPESSRDLITSDRARELGLRAATGIAPSDSLPVASEAGGRLGVVQDGSVSITLENAGDYPGKFPSHVAAYPIWVVRANGTFRPSFGIVGQEFTFASVFVDAIEGTVMSVRLEGEVPSTGEGHS